MNRLAFVSLAALALASCGPAGETGGDVPAPARPAPTAAEKAALLSALPDPYNQADLDNGRRVFARCRSCHTITPEGPNMTGPNLYGVFGRQAGSLESYRYSAVVRDAGFVWTADQLNQWLENPRTFLRGTKMTFAGIPDDADRRDVIAFLKVETGYAPTARP